VPGGQVRPGTKLSRTVVNVILCEFYELNGGSFTFFLLSFVKLIYYDVQDDVMRDAK